MVISLVTFGLVISSLVVFKVKLLNNHSSTRIRKKTRRLVCRFFGLDVETASFGAVGVTDSLIEFPLSGLLRDIVYIHLGEGNTDPVGIKLLLHVFQ